MLAGPFHRQVGEARNSHSVRKSTLNGGSNEVRREERQRDCHIDLADAAIFPLCDAFGSARAADPTYAFVCFTSLLVCKK